MDRAKAKSMTRTVQTVAAVLAVLAVAAALIPLSAKAESPDASAPPPAPPKPVEPAGPKVDIDVTLLATALNSVSGPVKNQPPEPTPTETAPAPAPVITGIGAWRYLGAIMSSDYKRAIVVYNDQQHLLAEGQKVSLEDPSTPAESHNPANDVEIVQIDKLFVKVKQGEVETQIDLAPRQRAALTVLDPAGIRNASSNAAAANAAARGGGAIAPVTLAGSSESAATRRARDLERAKMDAKMRGDEKAAAGYDDEMTRMAKDGKLEKSEKGAK